MKLTAAKSMRYNGKALEPGDPFEAVNERDFRILKAIKKAVDPDESLDELRNEAAALGIEVDGRWGEARLNEKIAEAKAKVAGQQTYQRRDMRARD